MWGVSEFPGKVSWGFLLIQAGYEIRHQMMPLDQ